MSNQGREEAARLLREFFARLWRGEDLEFEEFVAQHREHEPELRRQYAQSLAETRSTQAFLERINLRPEQPDRYERVPNAGTKEGGQAFVFMVRDKQLERLVAMKVVKAVGESGSPKQNARSFDEHAGMRFVRGAQVAAQLFHPGVLPVLDIGRNESGRHWYTMPWVDGFTFLEVIGLVHKNVEGWTMIRAVRALHRVCETVAYAHSRGFLHRDLKPANIMVGSFGEVFVMDWGIARHLGEPEWESAGDLPAVGAEGEDTPQALTRAGDVLGTPSYMAPEQALGEVERLGESADIYSIGATVYHLLAGHSPYDPDRAQLSDEVILERVRREAPEPIRERAPRAPAELVAICDKAMARDPSARYRSMIELVEDLRAYLEGRVVRTHRAGPWTAMTKWVLRNPGLSAALGMVLVLGLCSALAFRQVHASDRQQRIDRFLDRIAVLRDERPMLSHEGSEPRWRESQHARLEQYVGDFLDAFAAVGVPLDGALQPDEICAALATLLGPEELLDVKEAMYDLADGLIGQSRIAAHPEGDWGELLEQSEMWGVVLALIDRLEPDEWRREAWSLFLDPASVPASLAALSEGRELTGEVLQWLGERVHSKGDTKLSRSLFERAVTVQPDLFGAHYRLGLHGGFRDGLDRRLHHHELAFALRPHSAIAAYGLGWDYQYYAGECEDPEQRARFEELARRYYKKAIENNPHLEKAYCNLALILSKKDGIALLRQYLEEHSPTENGIFVNLAMLCDDAGDGKGTVEAARGGIKLTPDDPRHYYYLGRGLDLLGKRREAVAAYVAAVRVDPRFWAAWANASSDLLRIADRVSPGDEPSAEARLLVEFSRAAATEATCLEPSVPDTWINLGAALCWTEEYDSAVDAFERAHDLESDVGYFLTAIRDELLRLDARPDLVRRIDAIQSRVAAADPGSPP